MIKSTIIDQLLRYIKGDIECGHRVLMCSGEGDFVEEFPKILVLVQVGDETKTATYYHENALPVTKSDK